jgi:parallel beta-helix repeat protein
MITVENCLLMNFPTGIPTGPGGDGVYVGRSSGGAIPQEIRVLDNTITGNERQGISVTSVSGMLISGNHITHTSGTNPGAGMDFEPNSDFDSIRDVRILGNRITNNAGPGIMLYNGNDYVIDDIVISDNHIRENGSHGIHLYRTANGYVGNYSITGNIIRSNGGSGMLVHACKAHGMVISGNTLWQNADNGMRVLSSRGFIINSNSICFNGSHGIRVEYIYGGHIEGNIASNTIMNNGASSPDTYSGIEFPGNDSHPDSRCLVSGNVIGNSYGAEYQPTQKYGIYMGGAADRIVCNGNWTFNHTAGGVYEPGYTFAPMGFNYDDAAGYFGTDQAGAVQTVSESSYIRSNVGLVLADAANGEVDPRLSPSHVGHRITVVKTDASANKVVVRGQPSETVGGTEYFELFNQYDYVTCVFIGDSKWAVVANK